MTPPQSSGWMNHIERPSHIRRWAIALCFVVFIELVALGANGDLLSVAAAVLELAVTIFVVMLYADDRFLRSTWPVISIVAILIMWSALPQLRLFGVELPFRTNVTVVAPDLLFPALIRLCGAIGLLLAAAVIGYRGQSSHHVVTGLVVFGLFQIVIGLGLREYDPEHVWGFERPLNVLRYSGTMTNVNANACAAAVTAVLGVTRLQTLSAYRLGRLPTNVDWLMRAVCALAAIGGIGVCLISGSRAPSVIAAVAIGALVLTNLPVRTSAQSKLLALVPCFIIIIVLALIGGRTIERMSDLSSDGLDRLSLWRHYAHLLLSTPLFGYGLRSFGPLNIQTLSDPADATHLWFVNSAHNVVIETIIEGGYVFAGLIVIIIALMLSRVIDARKTIWRDPVNRGVALSITVILLCAMVDIALDVPAIVAMLFLLAGSLWGCSLLPLGTGRVRRRGEIL